MSLRDRLRRLERASEGVTVSIPQPYGPPARFPESELERAFLCNVCRATGDDIPPHPLSLAAGRSPDPTWRESFFADGGGPVSPPPDLSE